MVCFVVEVEVVLLLGLVGLIWFCLLIGDDCCVWSFLIWLVVLECKLFKGGLVVQLVVGQGNDVFVDICIDNVGNVDVFLLLCVCLNFVLWDVVFLGNVCSGDGINGYMLESDVWGCYLCLGQVGLLCVGSSCIIGWLCCVDGMLVFEFILEMGF